MMNTVSVGISATPAAKLLTVSGLGHYCAGGAGDTIALVSSDFGVDYQLFKGNQPVVSLAGTGTVGPDYGLITDSGNYYVIATDAITTCTATMTGIVSIHVDPLPIIYNVTGGGSYCFQGAGVHNYLSQSQTGVDYSLVYNGIILDTVAGTGGVIDFGQFTNAGDYTVTARSTSATGCHSDMAGMATVSINRLPDTYAVTVDNTGHYCSGASGPHISLAYSALGVGYQLMRGTTPVGAPISGLSSQLDMGEQRVSGNYFIIAENAVTHCIDTMQNSVTVTRDSLPVRYTVGVTNGGSYCAGGTGQHVLLNGGSVAGTTYDLYNGSALAGTLTGTGTSLDFGTFTTPGTYSILATNAITSCSTSMTGTVAISINPLPLVYPMGGGGSFCAGGAGLPITLSNSRSGVKYQLFNNGTPVGSAINGSGSALNFGIQSASGTYTIEATNQTTFCTNMMGTGLTITANPLPTVYYMTIANGGVYCAGGTGVHVGLSGSDLGVKYQLYHGSTAMGSPIPGDGNPLDFGLQTATGSYSVVALNAATPCTSNMLGTVNVSTVAPPAIYTLTGSGHYCSGGAGIDVRMSGSSIGNNYQLYNSGTPVGGVVAGAGSGIDFGYQLAGGTYTVIAANGTTACTRNMSGSPTIVVDQSPVIYAVTGGGTSCSAGLGAPVGLIGSDLNVNYQLYIGSTPTPRLPVGGTEAALDFGNQLVGGTYKVVGTNLINGCRNTMSGTAVVNIIPSVSPAVTVTSSRGDTICVGSLTTFTATSVNGGTAPSYQWSINGANVSAGPSYTYVPANGDNVSATVTSNATCVLSPTASSAIRMNVIIYQLPTAAITAIPGVAVCTMTPVTYHATETYGGSAPVYSWVKNGHIVGSGLSYTTTPDNNDIITFMVNSNLRCHSADTVFSNIIKMEVANPLRLVVKIQDHVNDKVIVGHIDTLEAYDSLKEAVGPFTYQWYVNGAVIPGAINKLYVNNSIFDADLMSCTMTAFNACGAKSVQGSLMLLHLKNTGIVSQSNGMDVLVAPNPNKGTFTVQGTFGNTTEEEVSLTLTNMLGQSVYTANVPVHNGTINEQVALNNVAAGNYLLNVSCGADSKVFHVVLDK